MQKKRLSLISHDIRSALGDIVGGLHLIDDSSLDDTSRRQVDRVRAAGDILGRLVSEALGVMAGDPTFSDGFSDECTAEVVMLTDMLGELDRRWGGHAAALGLEFQLEVDKSLPERIRTRSALLERILSNLLDNALKYAEFGLITLSVRLGPSGAPIFTVGDEGPGFSDAALSRLFAFGGRPSGASQPGSGLGLHIAKELSDQLGARLSVDNVSDANGQVSGARVSLILPPDARLDDRKGGVVSGLPNLSGMRILVAEDNKTNQLLIKRMLDHLGADYVFVEDGDLARATLASQIFDLAIMDIELPHLSGLDAIRATRGLPGRRGSVPILAATAFVLRSERDDIYDAGADAILSKPILSLEAFAAAIKAALQRRRTETQAETETTPPAAATPPLRGRAKAPCSFQDAGVAPPTAAKPAPIARTLSRLEYAPRLSHLMEIAGPEGRRELIERLDADLTRAARRLSAAAEDRDRAMIRSETHVLVSLTGAVGATALQSMMENLNAAAHNRDWAKLDVLLGEAAPALVALCTEISGVKKHTRSAVLDKVRRV